MEPIDIIPRAEHNISRDDISNNALKVLYRLKGAGFSAYLVGGSVRDLLLHKKPKDFDVATNAKPEQVRKLFRNCRLIGRRFRLAHILFGKEIIEVATFRRDSSLTSKKKKHHSGMILSDNVYGTISEDAFRRDFTVNALYYNIDDFSLVDYTHGLRDFQQKTLRLIGDPMARYKEDPVRMLRAIRFAAKLDFSIHAESEKPLLQQAHLIEHVSADRLFDEVIKLFHNSKSIKSYQLLQHYGMFAKLFPQTAEHLNDDKFTQLLIVAFNNTDKRIQENKTVTPAFLFSALLWRPMQAKAQQLEKKGLLPLAAVEVSMRETLKAQCKIVNIPKRFSQAIKEIWILQYRLPRRYGKRAFSLLQHPRFRASYDFLLLRSQTGEEKQELADWWTEFQVASTEDRENMVKNLQVKPKKRRSHAKKSAE